MTTYVSAAGLLAGQLVSMPDIEWTVVSGDRYPAPPDGVTSAVVPMSRELSLGDLRSFARLVRFFRRNRFDLVQTHTPKASLLGLPAARLTGHRTLYTMHGAFFFREQTRRANVLGWLFERWNCSWAHRVAMQSAEDVDVVVAARACPRRKAFHLGNGIDVEHFRSVPARPPDRAVPTVLMASRLVREKGCLDFFEVAARLRDRAHFVHIGAIEHDQHDAISAAEAAAIEQRTGATIAGWFPDVRPWYADADVFLLPSQREGIPRAAMEAAVMGRPVVAYDVRGTREVVPFDELLVPQGDVDALTEVVRDLVADPAKRVALGAGLAAFVAERFDERDVVARLRGLYRAMGVPVTELEGGARRGPDRSTHPRGDGDVGGEGA